MSSRIQEISNQLKTYNYKHKKKHLGNSKPHEIDVKEHFHDYFHTKTFYYLQYRLSQLKVKNHREQGVAVWRAEGHT